MQVTYMSKDSLKLNATDKSTNINSLKSESPDIMVCVQATGMTIPNQKMSC